MLVKLFYAALLLAAMGLALVALRWWVRRMLRMLGCRSEEAAWEYARAHVERIADHGGDA